MSTEAKSYRIGFNPDFAPFIWADGANGAGATGPVADRLRDAAKQEGATVSFVALPLPELQGALADGRVDAIAPTGQQKNRADSLDFSAPLARTGGAWFVPKGRVWEDDDVIGSFGGAGLSAATPKAGPLFAHIEKTYPDMTLVAATDYANAFELALNGRVGAAALNLHVGTQMAERDHPGRFDLPDKPFLKVPLVLAVAKGDPAGALAALGPAIRALGPAAV